MDGKWRVKSERRVYDNDWVTVDRLEVEQAEGESQSRHLARFGDGTVRVIVHDPAKGVLLRWRHRFAGYEWGWELPGGQTRAKERPSQTAAREVKQQTGWQPGKLKQIAAVQPLVALVEHPVYFFVATDMAWDGLGRDATEAADISWIPLDQIKTIMSKGEMSDGLSQLGLLRFMQSDELNP